MSVYWWLADASESCLRHLVALSLVTSKCMHGTKRKSTVTNRAFRNFLRNRSEWQRRWTLGTKESILHSQRTVPPGTKRFHYKHWLHAEDVLRAGVTLLIIMRAGARFTVSPFKWSGRVGPVLWCWGGVVCVCFAGFCLPTGPVSRHSWIYLDLKHRLQRLPLSWWCAQQ